tara:strand:+ start:60 stop:752 length:693 start_codon:yes stop_codon:yes gene_type:complete
MNNYYTRKEAANILGVTPTTVSKYIKDGLLKNIGNVKNILIPCEDIHHFYQSNHKLSNVSRAEMLSVEKKIDVLRSEMEVLKLVMGIGTPRPARTDSQLLSLFMDIMKLLSLQTWSTSDIFSIADIMVSIKDSEVARMLHLKGTKAWNGIFDLSGKMVRFIESNPALPKEASDMMCSRIEAGKNRLYGLLFVSLQSCGEIERAWAKRLANREMDRGSTDEFVISYLRNRK